MCYCVKDVTNQKSGRRELHVLNEWDRANGLKLFYTGFETEEDGEDLVTVTCDPNQEKTMILEWLVSQLEFPYSFCTNPISFAGVCKRACSET